MISRMSRVTTWPSVRSSKTSRPFFRRGVTSRGVEREQLDDALAAGDVLRT
jgi:hypothetical protein